MRAPLVPGLVAAAIVAACGDPFGLPAPNYTNVVDTVSLYALTGTDINTPSAYRLEDSARVFVHQSTAFDFAFDIDTSGRALIKPTGAIPLARNSAVRTSSLAFDSIHIAPTTGYVVDSGVVVDAGTRVIVQSRVTTCSWGGQSVYFAKLEVLAIDTLARRIDFQILVDQNCGYRGLDPGTPRR